MDQKSGADPPTKASPPAGEAPKEMGRHLIDDGPLSEEAHESLSVCKHGESESRGSSKDQTVEPRRSMWTWMAFSLGVVVDLYDIHASLARAFIAGVLAIGLWVVLGPAIALAPALVCAAELAVAVRVIRRLMHEEPFSTWIYI